LKTFEQYHKDLEQEVNTIRARLHDARDVRAQLEEKVLSLTEAVGLLQSKLKAEGMTAVTEYKASREFESGLEKMGRVSYEFGYRVALKRFRAKYPDSTVEEYPFPEYPEDENVKMDLCQPFDDSTTPQEVNLDFVMPLVGLRIPMLSVARLLM
ncbi:hypothetical protein B296_00053406, partial [Ensete ventricosum]